MENNIETKQLVPQEVIAIINSEQNSSPVINAADIPRKLLLGPLTFGEWDAEFTAFFLHLSEKSYGKAAARAMQGHYLSLIDQFLSVDQADLDLCYETNKDNGFKRIEKWPMMAMGIFQLFHYHMADKLGMDFEEIRSWVFAFLGLRIAQAMLSMRGTLSPRALYNLNSENWLGKPEINLRIYR
ncbi:MAG: hypothetical protein WC890_03375 [Candidatus Margulisiibacteriota bacterium]